MITDFLDRNYVLSQTKAQRDWLVELLAKKNAKDARALSAMAKYKITPEQIERAIAALDAVLRSEAESAEKEDSKAFIPSNPVVCGLQMGMTRMAYKHANTISLEPSTTTRRAMASPKRSIDTSPTDQLKKRSTAGQPAHEGEEVTRAPFIEGDDIHYGLDGFMAKFGALFTSPRHFNKAPARVASSDRPMTLFVFGDWGTGLPLAQEVTKRIREQIDRADGTRQQHVVHLGDVYYVGEKEEYLERVLAAGFWPVRGDEKDEIGSWSLNGNHDRYSGGHGYFDTLLREARFIRWHGDDNGEPSSFFCIEDANWQFFGLDTAWNVPSLASAVFGTPTLNEYGGQNGILTPEQARWMAQQRDRRKGCVLLTHHQPAASRTTEEQHSDQAVRLLKQAGVYDSIDAWFWGHEHRCVVFAPKAERTNPRLKSAPNFCACIGHGGVPVTKENFEEQHKITEAVWEENRLDASAPIYEGERVVPFGFARIDTNKDTFDFRIFDHAGSERYHTVVTRAGVDAADLTVSRSIGRAAGVRANRAPVAAEKGIKKKKAPVGSASKPAVIAEWTILVFMAGDNNLDAFGLKDLQEMKKIGSNDKVHVVVQRDSAADDHGARRYYIRKGTTLEQDELQTLGNTNTGDPKVLTEFLTWGLANYPAKRTMAVLWNHGNGWDDTDIYAEAKRRGLDPVPSAAVPIDGLRRGLGGTMTETFPVHRNVKQRRLRGSFFLTAYRKDSLRRAIAFDDDAQDFLDNVEMKKVFAKVASQFKHKFDIIGMDACLMSMIETGMQLQGSGEVFCGSQEIEPGNGWPYDRILERLNKNPTMNGKSFASIIVKEFVDSYPITEVVTQAAFDLTKLSAVQAATDALGNLLAQALSQTADLALEGAISRARKQSQKYEHPDYVDLWDFSVNLATLWPQCAEAAKTLQKSIAGCVFANAAPHVNVKRSHGLSIYLPEGEVNTLYHTLDFAKGGWSKFLAAYKG